MYSAKLQDTGSTNKTQVYFYTLPVNNQKGNLKIIIFTVVSKWIKYVGTNLMKDMQDIITANHSTLLKEFKAIDYQQVCYYHSKGERQSFQQKLLWQLDIHIQKNEVNHTSYIFKN